MSTEDNTTNKNAISCDRDVQKFVSSIYIVSHTKFAPEGYFELLKSTFQKTEVSSLRS